MTQTNAAERGTVTRRSGSSRKLLARKALTVMPAPAGEALEDVFPTGVVQDDDTSVASSGTPEGAEVVTETAAPAGDTDGVADATPADGAAALPPAAAEPAGAPPVPATPEQQPAPPPPSAWSEEDEATFQAMTARRRAAGYQRRGRDVGGQLLRVGDIAPNAGTVAAAIVALVAERGTVGRTALLDAVASCTLAHPKAKPADRAWAQGYIAGAVRDGFLALASDEQAGAAEVTR